MDGIIWFGALEEEVEDMADAEVLQEMDNGLGLVVEAVEDMELMEVME